MNFELLARKLNANTVLKKTFWVIFPLIIVGIFVVAFYFKLLISNEIESKMNHQLNEMVFKIDQRLTAHSKVAELLARNVETFKSSMSKKQYAVGLTKYIASNEDTFGAGIWFEPYKYSNSAKYFGPYSYRNNGTISYTDDYSLPSYDYPHYEWYKVGKNTKKQIVWTDPYYDPVAKIAMATATAPFYDDNGNFMGVTTADISLSGIQKIVQETKIGEKGWSFVVDSSGQFIAHPDNSKIMKQNIKKDENKQIVELGDTLAEKQKGKAYFSDNNGNNLVLYSPISNTGWSLAIVMPENELYQTIIVKICVGSILFISILGFLLYVVISKTISNPLAIVVETIKEVADGNLSVPNVEVKSQDEIASLSIALNNMIDSLKAIVGLVSNTADEISASAEEMAASIDQTSQGAQQVTVSVAQVATGTDQMADSVNQLAKGTQRVAINISDLSNKVQNISKNVDDGSNSINEINKAIQDVLNDANTVAQLGNETENNAAQGKEHIKKAINKIDSIKTVSGEISDTISELGQLSSEIEGIVDLIKSIAGQTNLLALNAAIEAARAGEHGKGFAVVADEVKKLATQSAEATDKITEIIKEIQQKTNKAVVSMDKGIVEVQEGVLVVNDAGSALESIIEQVKTANTNIQSITREIGIVASGSVDLVEMVKSISELTVQAVDNAQEISAITEQTAANAQEISSVTEQTSASTQQVATIIEAQTTSMEDISANSQSLVKIAENLNQIVSAFKL